mmetsp:Transcript_19664/g.41413  ORF Transcript_19664/g.41413 Transcript_19664/m.41413 type:complete len:132 (+) Transcript_19664:152-547(+)
MGWNIFTILASGYCLTGSDKYPDIAGLIRNPYAHIPITIPIIRVSKASSPRAYSDTSVLTGPRNPLHNPSKNRKVRANGNVGAKPKSIDTIADRSSDALMMLTLPYLSAALPHSKLEKLLPAMKEAPINPA